MTREPASEIGYNNTERMYAWVEGHREIARNKSPAEAKAYLQKWADWLGTKMREESSPSKHFVGISALDFATARDLLITPLEEPS